MNADSIFLRADRRILHSDALYAILWISCHQL